jgi:hypothetical protein
MNIWQKLFGKKQPAEPQQPGPWIWLQLPTMSAMALLDADAFTRAPIILHGMLGLRDVLIAAAKTVFSDFSDGTPDVLKQLIARKCQLLASVDTSAGVAASRLGPETRSFCTEQGIEVIDSSSDGLGIPILYSATLTEAWGEFHIIVDANLTKEHWRSLFAMIPREIDAPARMAFGKSADGRYVVALLHREMVVAHDLVSRDAGKSFSDFCTCAATRMKKEQLPYDTLALGQVLGQSSKR